MLYYSNLGLIVYWFSWNALLGFCTFILELSVLIAVLAAAPLSMLLSLNIHPSVIIVAQYTFSVYYRRAVFVWVLMT